MRLIALHGRAGAGKDTFADRLVGYHGFVKRGFADPLYEEVAAAFGVGVDWLRDRERKEVDQDLLRVARCADPGFVAQVTAAGEKLLDMRSPRWVLQRWGTDYRRAQCETYWLDRMEDFYDADFGRRGLVIPDCRFLNEAQWVCARRGAVVQIVRPDLKRVHSHVSEIPLPGYMIERTVHNHGSIALLHSVADSVIRGAERIAERRA